VTAHAQKPDFVFRRNGRFHLNGRGRHFSPTTGSRGVRINGSNAGYTMFRGSEKGTDYPLHSLVFPSLPLPASPYAITFQLDCTRHLNYFVLPWRNSPQWARAASLSRLHDHTQTQLVRVLWKNDRQEAEAST
jgi:hypothetical protein